MFQRRAKRLFVKVGGSMLFSALRESCSAPRVAMLGSTARQLGRDGSRLGP